ncbi:MAG: glycosyltransferase, partial [Planctomycetota bacterium]|nr:glycosyltransferase [Planctomycetota bacterium]
MNWSVVIPTLNEAGMVSRAIESALEAGAHEVIVADGGSADDTIPISIAAGATVTASTPGRGPQLNSGARASSGAILLFLHADNWLSKACGEQIDEAFRAGNEFCCFRQTIDHPAWVYRFIEKGNTFRAKFQRLPYGDQGICTTRRAFERIGGF